MSHFGSRTEYGLHCLLTLYATDAQRPMSSRDLAEFQGLSLSFVSKLLTALERAGLIRSTEGRAGGFVLARAASEISVLDAVEALEGRKKLFDCKEIRRECALFDAGVPRWASGAPCEINAVIGRAESAMRNVLSGETLADLHHRVSQKSPRKFAQQTIEWFDARHR